MLRFAKMCIIPVVVFVLVLGCFGCSSSSYKLDKEESISTKFGPAVQFKICSEWKRLFNSNQVSLYGTVYGVGELAYADDNEHVSLYVFNPEYYDPSYSAWLESRHYDEGEESWGGRVVSNYSMEELGSIDINSVTFRLFKETYAANISDKDYAEAIKKYPETKQHNDIEAYYAVYIEGDRYMEIQSNSEQLLKDFMKTLQIKW